MLDIARSLSAPAPVHSLLGSSRPGAVPPLVTLSATAAHPDAEVIDLAGRVKRLAERDHRIWDRRAAIEDAVDAAMPALPPRPEQPVRGSLQEVEADGLRITTITVPTTPDAAYEAALSAYESAVAELHRLDTELSARLGYPRWEKLSKRTFARLVRWTERLALLRPQTEAGLKAKVEVQGVLAATGNAGDWMTEFASAVGQDATRIATGLAGMENPDAELLALGPMWEASAARCDGTMEVRDAAEERWQVDKSDEAGLAAAQAADAEAGEGNRALRRRIIAMPARTMDGILLKARVARWCYMDDEDEIAQYVAREAQHAPAAGETAAFSILLDLARMVGTVAPAAPAATTMCNLRPVPLPAGLPGIALAASEKAGDVREWYRSWLYTELRLLNLELDGDPEISAVWQNNPGADFHFPAEMDWKDVPKPSTRATAVLGLLGILPTPGADGAPLPIASAA